MSFFEGQTPGWQHRRQQSWNPQPHSPVQVGPNPSAPLEDYNAFASQYEEVLRATENLAKSGRLANSHGRSESMPYSGTFLRQYPEIDSRLAAIPPKYPFNREPENTRSTSNHPNSSLQGYISHQRYGTRVSDTDQILQAKRRAAAQRERELRNYHQEQQYNRSLPTAKSDRSMSPGSMSEDDRRELIARQHRALYGTESSLYGTEANTARPVSQDARVIAAISAGHSSSSTPLDRLGLNNAAASNDASTTTGSTIGGTHPSRANSATPPTGVTSAYPSFDIASPQPNRASSSSPSGSPGRHVSRLGPSAAAGVAPIGTRPVVSTTLTKRSTPPQPSVGFSQKTVANTTTTTTTTTTAAAAAAAAAATTTPTTTSNERTSSAASNAASGGTDKGVALAWNGSNGPWGSNKSGTFGSSVQASVWG